MRVSTVDGTMWMFLHVEQEQSVLSDLVERQASWLRGFTALQSVCVFLCVCACVCLNTRFDCVKLGSNSSGWLKPEPGSGPTSQAVLVLLSSRALLSTEMDSSLKGPQQRHHWSQILSYWAMLHVREYWHFKYLLLPCLKYCICPALFMSMILHFALLYIHTRTYWNAWQKHLIAFCGLFLFIHLHCFFVCMREGKLSVWYWYIKSVVYLFKMLTDNLVPGSNRRSAAKTVEWNQGPVALLVTQIQTVV